MLELGLEGLDRPLEPTYWHRLYSLTANDWVPAGWLHVVAIEACPPIAGGTGRVVLSTYTHFNGYVMDLGLEGLDKPLEPTRWHRLYSLTANDWVPAAWLRVGDELETVNDPARINSLARKGGAYRVYNLEIQTDHCYYASALAVLCHNSDACDDLAKAAVDAAKTGVTKGMGGRVLSTAEQAEFDAFAARVRSQGLVENPYRTGSWGKMENGKFVEQVRIDVGEAGEPGW